MNEKIGNLKRSTEKWIDQKLETFLNLVNMSTQNFKTCIYIKTAYWIHSFFTTFLLWIFNATCVFRSLALYGSLRRENGKFLFATTFTSSFTWKLLILTYTIHLSHSNLVWECCWHILVCERTHGTCYGVVGSSFFLHISLQCSPIASWCPQLQDVYIMFNKIFQKHTLTLKWTFSVKRAKKFAAPFVSGLRKENFLLLLLEWD